MSDESEKQSTIDLAKKLQETKGFMVTVTIIKEDGSLEHNLFTRNFPVTDMLPAEKKHKELIVEHLESFTDRK